MSALARTISIVRLGFTTLSPESSAESDCSPPAGMMYRFGNGTMIMVTRPHNNEPATSGNGTMFAIEVEENAQVARMHEKALSLGGKNEGAPGPRGNFGEFAYFRDLDGNKFAVYCPRK